VQKKKDTLSRRAPAFQSGRSKWKRKAARGEREARTYFSSAFGWDKNR
jgi:hypothetical protein